MTPLEKPGPSSLSSMQGPAPYDHEEIAELRRRAWTEQGLLIASPSDRRLGEHERHLLIRIAEALYGKPGKP